MMGATLLDGRRLAAEMRAEIAEGVCRLQAEDGVTPGLGVILVGADPASASYVAAKEKACAEAGMFSDDQRLPADVTQEALLAEVGRMNDDPRVHGILVQSPPPPQIDEREITLRIDPKKDVVCFHPYNVGKMLIGDTDGFYPCTPYGVMVLLERSGIDPAGKHAVILGRSNIVGKPMMALLVQKTRGANATVTVCHSRTPDIKDHCRRADLIVAAIGKAEFLRADMVKPGAVVIDVGINRVDDPAAKRGYRLVGDVAYAEVAEVASWITPVPGGVGPMTIAMLMQNAVKACKLQNGVK